LQILPQELRYDREVVSCANQSRQATCLRASTAPDSLKRNMLGDMDVSAEGRPATSAGDGRRSSSKEKPRRSLMAQVLSGSSPFISSLAISGGNVEPTCPLRRAPMTRFQSLKALVGSGFGARVPGQSMPINASGTQMPQGGGKQLPSLELAQQEFATQMNLVEPPKHANGGQIAPKHAALTPAAKNFVMQQAKLRSGPQDDTPKPKPQRKSSKTVTANSAAMPPAQCIMDIENQLRPDGAKDWLNYKVKSSTELEQSRRDTVRKLQMEVHAEMIRSRSSPTLAPLPPAGKPPVHQQTKALVPYQSSRSSSKQTFLSDPGASAAASVQAQPTLSRPKTR